MTVAGGRGKGDRANQLNYPCGLFVDEDQTIYIADWMNHRIVAWKGGAMRGEVLTSAKDQVNRLNHPRNVIVDRKDG